MFGLILSFLVVQGNSRLPSTVEEYMMRFIEGRIEKSGGKLSLIVAEVEKNYGSYFTIKTPDEDIEGNDVTNLENKTISVEITPETRILLVNFNSLTSVLQSENKLIELKNLGKAINLNSQTLSKGMYSNTFKLLSYIPESKIAFILFNPKGDEGNRITDVKEIYFITGYKK